MVKEYCDTHSGCVNQIETNKGNISTLFQAVEKIKNRPPVWATLAFSVALGVIGWLAKGHIG
jgi:hypothetical protein